MLVKGRLYLATRVSSTLENPHKYEKHSGYVPHVPNLLALSSAVGTTSNV